MCVCVSVEMGGKGKVCVCACVCACAMWVYHVSVLYTSFAVFYAALNLLHIRPN